MSEATDATASEDFPFVEKLVATGIHLLVSMLAVGALLLLVTQLWYPGFLFGTDGGWQGLRIVVLVDLVLGPLLTFVVYRRGKKGLAMDLTLIGALQIAALLGGGWVVQAERPLALVHHEGRFFSVTSGDYLEAGVPVPDLSGIVRPPAYVVLVPPESPLEQSPVRTALLGRGQFLYSHVPWMRPADAHRERVLASALAPEQVARTDAEQALLDAWLESEGRNVEDVALIPYSSRFRIVYVVMERSSGRLLDALDISSRR